VGAVVVDGVTKDSRIEVVIVDGATYSWGVMVVPKDNIAKIFNLIERENNQMQWRLDRYHAIQKARKHLKGKGQDRAINSINEISNLASDNEISDFSDSSNDDFQKYLPRNMNLVVKYHYLRFSLFLIVCHISVGLITFIIISFLFT
jgi:hypothetical protein